MKTYIVFSCNKHINTSRWTRPQKTFIYQIHYTWVVVKNAFLWCW